MRFYVLLIAVCTACGDGPFAPCDIRDHGCQKRVVAEVEHLRGSKGHIPKIRVRSEADVVAEHTASITDDDRAEFARENHVYALFGLSTDDVTLESFTSQRYDQTAAYYSEDTKDITVIDHDLNQRSSTLVLAHELVHSMQDAEGLIALAKADIHSTDKLLARHAMIEGEAAWYQVYAQVDMDGHTPDEVRWSDYFSQWQGQQLSDAQGDSTSIYDANFQFEYAFGASYMYQRWSSGGQSAIEDVYNTLPDGTYEVAHATHRDASRFLGDNAVATLADGYTQIFDDQLGWWMADVWSRHFAPTIAVESLIDDAFTGILAPDGSTIAMWRARFAGANTGVDDSGLDSIKGHHYQVIHLDTNDVLIIKNDRATPIDLAAVVTGWRAFEN